VGVNRFQIDEPPPENLLRVDPEVETRQKARIADLKKRRDNTRVQALLASLEKAASGEENIMPHVVEAVRNYATLGEISDALRRVFKEYEQKVVF
jgi:methylmalonyl-CoA mutase N-terminal domain/subunit